MKIRAIDLVDVLAYLVVLGSFVQLFPQVISESFLLTLLTAILLKAVLEVVLLAKKAVVGRFRAATGRAGRIAAIAALLVVMPGSKFVVLELTALAFGDRVYLGGFFQVTLLIITLMLARGTARRLLERTDSAAAKSPRPRTD